MRLRNVLSQYAAFSADLPFIFHGCSLWVIVFLTELTGTGPEKRRKENRRLLFRTPGQV
ncbi:hypothetical protein MmTuc01_0885 [Methanosarcina mazei Tuc01]|uniref:Uncharacterized protein n=1 Tax=Methanosarcina mazei Tuc01 TaxID=1236903 RepID=M1P786_METMZ|nr:hypothetical protein MmTuc01_0885 [Methanosarcina mazei Tuc01]